MSKAPKKAKRSPRAKALVSARVPASDFDEVLQLIDAARLRAVAAVNTTLIELYLSIGEFISRKLESAVWGEGVVEQLAAHIAQRHPGLRGFTRPNLFRMRQFYETYRGDEKVSALLRQLPWTHHLAILGHTKRREERLFYVAAAAKARWSSRELQRELRTHAFGRKHLGSGKVSAALSRIHPIPFRHSPSPSGPFTIPDHIHLRLLRR